MEFTNVRNFHERINLWFHSSLALPLLPIGFIFLEANHNNWKPSYPGNSLILIISLVAAVLIAVYAYQRYRNSLQRVRDQDRLADQFAGLFREYRKLYLASMLSSLLLAAGYYFTASPYLIGTYVILLFSLSLLRPYYERYNRDLQLDDQTAKAVRKMSLSFEEGSEET